MCLVYDTIYRNSGTVLPYIPVGTLHVFGTVGLLQFVPYHQISNTVLSNQLNFLVQKSSTVSSKVFVLCTRNSTYRATVSSRTIFSAQGLCTITNGSTVLFKLVVPYHHRLYAIISGGGTVSLILVVPNYRSRAYRTDI